MKENLNMIREASLEGLSAAQVKAFDLAESARERMSYVFLAMILAVNALVFAPQALAAGCDQNDAGKSLVDFIEKLTNFVVFIGGALAILIIVVGAAMIIVATSSDKKKKGMDYIKNAIIGLLVLGGVFLLKFIVVALVNGAAGNKSNDCLESGTGGVGG